ncbi:helix-turn-helix domain-containing protein [Microbacterium insulae]|uniref:Helix-turn-helix domain-containing protein n=1 Tax=Microbacterium insulae TaxID=483014 RepID=A0ABW3AME3_9MICO
MPANKTAVALTASDFDLPLPLPVGLDVPEAAKIARIGVTTMWLAVNSGEVESVKLRGRVLIPTIPFLRKFGIEPAPVVVEPAND